MLVRGENQSTQGKTSQSREENQQTQPTYDVRSGNRTSYVGHIGGRPVLSPLRHYTETGLLNMIPQDRSERAK